MRRRWLAWVLALGVAGLALLAFMYGEAMRDPVIRRVEIAVAGLDRPVRVALLSDTHMSGPDMPPARLARIVGQVNAQRPDIVLLAGDYMGNDKPFGARFDEASSVAPFARLRAPLGVVAVLGNHDYWGEGTAERLRRAFGGMGVTLLDNQVVARGPLVIGGIEDIYNGAPDLSATVSTMKQRPGVRILLSHSPDVFPALDPAVALTLVGHTHCGQVRLPLIGALWIPSDYGRRFACGRFDAPGRTMIVGGGVGTSGLPIRLMNPPEFWIITLVPRLQ